MYKTIAVTNRALCQIPFLEQIEKVAKAKPDSILLREKHLGAVEYMDLAREVIGICDRYQVECILHTHVEVARSLKHAAIHLSLPLFLKYREELQVFQKVGVSVHSLEEALVAQKQKAHYMIVGHIFETDCKKGVEPRGIPFLEEICHKIQLPIYAIGGVNKTNIPEMIEAGAQGVCSMSGFMTMK